MATCPQCRTKYSDAMRACPRDGAALVADAFFSSATGAGSASLPASTHGIGPGSMIGDYRVEAQIFSGLGHGLMLERDWRRPAQHIADWLGEQGL